MKTFFLSFSCSVFSLGFFSLFSSPWQVRWTSGDSRVGLLISLFYNTFPKWGFFSSVLIHTFEKFQGPRKVMFYG